MKPQLCCLLILLSVYQFGNAQTNVPEFGTFTQEEKDLQVCDFDKEADAIVLLDLASSDHDDEYRMITNRRIRIKVLKEKGISQGDIVIDYVHYSDFEFISNVEAVIYNPGEPGAAQIQKLAGSQIFRQQVSDYRSAVKFAMPGVKVGSIIEYRYVSNMKNYSGLEDWLFQRDIPTRFSSYSLVILPNYEFAYQVHKSDALPINIQSEKGSGKILFEMKNVAGLRAEPFMDAPSDYIQRVEFQMAGYNSRFGGRTKYMTTWNEVTRELFTSPGFGRQLNKNLAGSAAFMSVVKLMTSPYEKMAAIYYYVQRNLTWDGYTGKYSESVKEAWEKKKGSNADINLILINLLQEANVEVYPVLVSERGHGKVDVRYPFIDQFNTVMAYVLIGKDFYVLDGASYGTPPFTMPLSVANTTAFVVDRKKGGIVTLSETKRMNKNLVNVVSTLDPQGIMKGRGTILSFDYARINRLKSYRQNKEKFTDFYLARNTPGMQVDSLEIRNLDNDSLPMDQQFSFTVPSTNTGEYRLLNMNIFTELEKNPFIADNRFTNIDYGCLYQMVLNQVVYLPDDWDPETLPRDIKMIMPDTSISVTRVFSFNKSTRVLQARFTVLFNRPVFVADEYQYLKEFYKKMTDILNEQVVLRKKATP